ncbi:hypothetical protein MASR2M47_15990 [Draconibacterium sp.]
MAQQSASATGGNIIGTSGSVSFTVGQVGSQYLSSADGTVSQGVQQPYEIFVVTAIDEASGISLDIQVYPNPVQDFLKLKIQGLNAETLIWEMYDLTGKMLGSNVISGTETLIPVSHYTAGTYLFSVTNKNNRQFKTYKIIKN